ncbi:MAG: restriction endonuclease subunit S, partial [Euryarchaeota archaeon]|nr:restriction endonuclease subunit S [Euryarchaeota archaeon]
KLNPYYFSIFLQSDYGKKQILRLPIGSVQQHIFLWQLERLIIPLYSIAFQTLIERVFKLSLNSQTKAMAAYSQAQTLLLSELGLLNWKPKHRLSFVKNCSKTQQAGRFDAEYFQPKYDEIVTAIKSHAGGWDIAENVLNIKDNNISPKHNVEYKYIELANIGVNGEIIGFTEAEGQDLPSRARRKVSKDDVIISSIEGSLSSCALIPDEYDGALCSTGFYIVDSTKINPQTLLVLLKSPIGQEQLKKGCSGTILTAINKDEIGKIVLPIVDSGIQHQIQQKIIESFNLRKQSKHLLECAKKAVEMAIEKDEETAMKWMESQLDGIEMGN